VTAVRKIVTRAKAQMCVLSVEDLSGSIDVVVFPRTFDRSAELWREDAILVLEGKVDTRDERPQIVLDRAEEWVPPARGTAPPPAARAIGNGSALVNGNGSALATGNGSGLVAGNGSGRLNGNGSPTASANGAVTDPSSKASDAANSTRRRVWRVVVPRGIDDATCLRVLEQLHGLVERNPGEDELELVLTDRRGGQVELAGAAIQLRHSADLEAQVIGLVGAANLVEVTEHVAVPS